MRLGDIIKDANSNLLRSKTRTLLTVIAIFIGALTLTITNGIGSGISEYIDQQLGNLGAEDVLVVQRKVDNPFEGGPRKYEEGQSPSSPAPRSGPPVVVLKNNDVKVISSISGVESAEPLLTVSPDFVVGASSTKYQFSVRPMINGMNVALVSGKIPDNTAAGKQITLPPDYSSVLGFDSPDSAIGKKIKIGITSALGKQQEVEAVIVGIQEQTLVSAGGAVINDPLLRSLYAIQTSGLPASAADSYPAVLARISSGDNESAVQAIKERLSAKGYEAQTIKDQIGLFKQVISAIVAVLNGFAAIALLAAGFGIVNTLLMSVQERTKEIGLMKAMGLSGRKIFLLFSIEALLLGFWGSLLGSLAGIGIGFTINTIAANGFLKDLPGFELTAFSPLSVIIIMLIIMGIAFIAGTLPARRASRKDPIEALRYE